MTKFSLHNKGLVLTGGGSGIGEAIALTFARQGATVYILDFNIEAAEETVKQIELEGFSAKAYACDISKQNEVNECIDKIAKLNSIDILINNAGIVSGKKLLENNPKLIEKTIAVNTTSHTYTL